MVPQLDALDLFSTLLSLNANMQQPNQSGLVEILPETVGYVFNLHTCNTNFRAKGRDSGVVECPDGLAEEVST